MFFTPAYQTLVILAVLMVVSFLLLLSYTFWTRTKKSYWQRYKKKFRDFFLPVLFSFVEDASEKSDADEIIKKLTKRTKDISFFLELLNEMSEILKGEDREKLNWLINHALFYQFYSKKLFSFSRKNQLLSCIYFGKSGSIDIQVGTRLILLSNSKNTKLAYAATKALQSSENIFTRKNALISFMKRDDASELMVGELLHLFYRGGMKMHLESGEALKSILLQKNVPAEKKYIIVLYFAHQNYYEHSMFLLNYLEKLLLGPDNRDLIIGLIYALGQLNVLEAASIIRQYASVKDVELRITCVEALSHFGGAENLAFLTKLILDTEFTVRKKIIEILVQHQKEGHLLLDQFMLTNLKLISQFRLYNKPSKDILAIVSKIGSVTNGIKIMSANQASLVQV